MTEGEFLLMPAFQGGGGGILGLGGQMHGGD